MPRTRQQNEEIRRQRKEAIMQSALRVYAEHGYTAADIGVVAERAGVARGLVYYYFKDKQQLFRTTFEHMLRLITEQTHTHFKKGGPVLELIESYIASMYEGLLAYPEYTSFFLRMGHDLPFLYTEAELKTARWYDEHLQPILEALERGMHNGEIRRMDGGLLLAQFWAAAVHGMTHSQRRAQRMLEEGRTKESVAAAIRPELRQALAVCMDIISAGRRSSQQPEPFRGSGVD